MIPIAYFAPMKAPTHATPSGDREIARALIPTLQRGGFAPDLASDLRCLDMHGDGALQDALFDRAAAQIPDLIARGRSAGWRLWLTYHNYYKAPDLLGPRVAEALGIPYVQIESTRARKRLTGPWARFAETAEAAAHSARVIFYFTHRDVGALRAYGPPDQRLVHLAPFLSRDTLPPESTRTGAALTAAMMRPGDKVESYRIIAATLAQVPGDRALDIAGDGAARDEVEALFAPFGDRVRFLGALDGADLAAAYAKARFFFWPGVNEAIGMVYLEAQAAGLPIIAQTRPGLIDGLAPHLDYPAPEDGPAPLAALFARYWSAPPDAGPIRAHIARHHLRPAAAETLRATLADVLA